MHQESKVYIGVDNGISGGLVALNDAGAVMAVMPMPIQKTRKGNEVQPLPVLDFINAFIATPEWMERVVVVIEEPGGSKSAKAGVSMAGSFHTLRTICEVKKLRHFRITPQSWQKVMLNCQKGDDTKAVAKQKAATLWPRENWLASPRCKVAHDGLIDAALIAEYARQKRF